jgi:hypothetical protein
VCGRYRLRDQLEFCSVRGGGGGGLFCVVLFCLCCSLVNLCVFVCTILNYIYIYLIGVYCKMYMSFLGGVNGPSFYLNTKIFDCYCRSDCGECLSTMEGFQ